ncbi:hypothetical protein MJO28_013721 [Puccinia striiformis f. sp. tritici]|uniref:Uncharacterized protein n=2 Tax=Puccinia striiformis f. sp. tritici TaxID=168172 RepID=A0A0L0VWV3_9BASI|nr:hypothetical protein Pst134EA_025739 [Puccinia striiformis f. sp. tritici]KAI9618454.1 hypothetical protein H4Q26_012275 [Puccinia striiformis f. sp. tritici PST-130]KNF03748.1 hypothetical protein PSTG_03269 [Puccinia striiformis f. sp. tritici PST-78]KAH9443962.1 hypothetical protein Pst134EB_026351 [Puccinia striiformis f. sp. tritici]KAH9451801.1 hypothetical protein Pst134EA_025739 [Puccinia striiformis f. sp. tritici]KAI7940069.1 hypothetical protein MJO28_013721 [Puccinia striiformis
MQIISAVILSLSLLKGSLASPTPTALKKEALRRSEAKALLDERIMFNGGFGLDNGFWNSGSSGQSSFPSSTDSPSHIGPVGQALINIHNPVPASHDSDFVNTYTGMYTKEAEQPSIASLSPTMQYPDAQEFLLNLIQLLQGS